MNKQQPEPLIDLKKLTGEEKLKFYDFAWKIYKEVNMITLKKLMKEHKRLLEKTSYGAWDIYYESISSYL